MSAFFFPLAAPRPSLLPLADNMLLLLHCMVIRARKATTLPLLRPVVGTDGQRITAVPVAQWQQVVVGVTAANRDEATWGADAWQWVPERWLTPEQRAEDALTGGDEWKKVAFEERGLEREGRLPGVYSGM